MRVRRLLALIVFLSVVLSLASCSDVTAGWCELWIVLPHGFEETETDGAFDVAYTDGEAVVGITRMSFEAAIDDGIPSTLSPLRFAEEYKTRTGLDNYSVKERGDVPYITYYTREGTEIFMHTVGFYKSYYAYFAVAFVVNSKREAKYSENLFEIFDSAYLDYGK